MYEPKAVARRIDCSNFNGKLRAQINSLYHFPFYQSWIKS